MRRAGVRHDLVAARTLVEVKPLAAADAGAHGPPASTGRPGFRRYWVGQTLSDLGSQVTVLVVPLLAVTVFDASVMQVGLLTFFSLLAAAVVMVPAGVVVDRVRHLQKLMVLIELARAVVMAWIPLAGWLGVLSLGQLYVVVLVEGVLGVFFRVAAASFVPVLAGADQRRLREYNGRLAAAGAGAQAAGPAAAAAAVGAIGTAMTILADALSYLVSAFSLARIRVQEPVAARTVQPRGSAWTELTDGLRFVTGHPVVSRIAAWAATWNLFSAAVRALTVVFLVRELHAGPLLIGVVLAVVALGGVGGAIIGHRLADRIGSARTMWVSAVWPGALYPLLALAQPGWGLAIAAVALLASNAAGTAASLVAVSYVQNAPPPALRARAISATEWLGRIGTPVGAIVGGVVATVAGVRLTLLVATVGMWAGSALWLAFSPIRTARDLEDVTHRGSSRPRPPIS
jgi:MFS family permease